MKRLACPTISSCGSIKNVGNYGEIFETESRRQDSPLKISRGLNALWTKGGLQYAPPVR